MVFGRQKNNLTNKFRFSTFGKVLIKFTSGQIIYNGLRMVSGFIVIRLIAPEIYGLFSGVAVFLGYVMLGHFGVINGLGREIPFQLGRKNIVLINDLAALGLWLSYAVGIMSSTIFTIFFISKVLNGSPEEVAIFGTYTIISFFQVMNKAYLPVLYRTSDEFVKLTRINISLALVDILSIILVWKFGLLGLCIRALILVISEFGLLYSYRPIKVAPSWNYNQLKLLLKTGLPIFIVGQIRPLWTTITRNLIFSLGGPLQFGYYALASMVNGALGIIPNSIGSVMYPRMSIQYGEGKPVDIIIKSVIKPTLLLFVTLLIAAFGIYFLLPVVVPRLLPKYVNGIEVAQWFAFLPVVVSLGLVNNIYNVLKQQKWYFVSLITGAILGLGYTVFMVWYKTFNLVYFAQGMMIGVAIQIVLSILFLKKLKYYNV